MTFGCVIVSSQSSPCYFEIVTMLLGFWFALKQFFLLWLNEPEPRPGLAAVARDAVLNSVSLSPKRPNPGGVLRDSEIEDLRKRHPTVHVFTQQA